MFNASAPVFIFDNALRDWLDQSLSHVASEARTVFESFLHANGINRLDQFRSMVPDFWAYVSDGDSEQYSRLAGDFVRIHEAVLHMLATTKFVREDFPLEEWTVDDVCEWVTTLPDFQERVDQQKICTLIRECDINGEQIKADPLIVQNEIKFRSLNRRTRINLCLAVQNVSTKKSDETITNSMPEEESSSGGFELFASRFLESQRRALLTASTSAISSPSSPTTTSPSSPRRGLTITASAPIAALPATTTSSSAPPATSSAVVVEVADVDEKDSMESRSLSASVAVERLSRYTAFHPFTFDEESNGGPDVALPLNEESFLLSSDHLFHRDPCNFKDIYDWTNEDVCRWLSRVEAIRDFGHQTARAICEATQILGLDGAHIVEYACRTKDGDGNPLRDVLPPEQWEVVRRSFNELIDFDAYAILGISKMIPTNYGRAVRRSDARGSSRSSTSRFAREFDFRLPFRRRRPRSGSDEAAPSSSAPVSPISLPMFAKRPSLAFAGDPTQQPPIRRRKRKRAQDIFVTDLDFRPEAAGIALDVPQSELQQYVEQRDLNVERQELEFQRFHLTQEYSALFKRESDGSDIAPKNRKCINGLWQLVCTEKTPFAQFPGPLPESIHIEIVWFLTGFERIESRALFRAMRSNLTPFEKRQAQGCSPFKSEFLFVHRYRQSIFDTNYEAKQRNGFIRNLYGEETLSDFQRARKERIRARRSECGNS